MESLLTRGDLIDQILVQCQRARESRERGEEENAEKRKKRRRKKIFSSSSSPSFSSSASFSDSLTTQRILIDVFPIFNISNLLELSRPQLVEDMLEIKWFHY